MLSKLDSDDVRIFLAVARSGSLSMAARLVGASQPTLGRRLARLERNFGLVLFQKSRAGYSLTPSGRKLLAAAESVMSAETAFMRQLEAEKDGAVPVIRIWTGVWLSKLIVCRMAALQAVAPCGRLVLYTEPHVDESQIGVNDIVIKHGRFKADNFVVRRLGCSAYAAFGSQGYVDNHPEASSSLRCETGSWILVHRVEEQNLELRAVPESGYPKVGGDAKVWLCTSAQTVLDVVCGGDALGFLPIGIGARSGLAQLSKECAELEHEYWLAYREESRRLPYVTAVAKELAYQLTHCNL